MGEAHVRYGALLEWGQSIEGTCCWSPASTRCESSVSAIDWYQCSSSQIPAELITLNPDYLGNLDRAPKEVIDEERRKAWEVCWRGRWGSGQLVLAFHPCINVKGHVGMTHMTCY